MSLSSTTAPSALTLTATTGTLAAGTYTATVAVASPVASNGPQTVSVTFTLSSASASPTIVLSPTSRNFSATQGGAGPLPQTVSVTNGGGGTLSGLTATVSYTLGQPVGWLSVSLSSTTAPATLTLKATTGSLAAGTYRATVAVASSVASNSPQTVSVTFTVTAAPTPPAAPSGLAATAVSSSQVNLSWTDNSGNEDGFRIERCTGVGCTGFAEIAIVGADAVTYQNTGLSASFVYSYRVRAYNAAGNSAYSNTATATTPAAVSPPAAPSNLTASAVSSSQINLSWTDNSGNEDGFRIERCTGAGCTSFAEIATVAANVTSYQNAGLSASTSYSYRVRAYNSAGNSAYSNAASAGTLWPPPVLQAPSTSGTSVTLTWTFTWPTFAATGEGYRLEQSTTSPSSGFSEILQIPGRTSPQSTTLTRPAGTYHFRVRAFVNQGAATYSEYSTVQTAVVTATVPAAPSNLTASAVSSSQINLSWTDNATNEDGFRIERCTGAGCTSFAQIATVAANVTSYQNAGLSASTSYSYRVRAYNSAGNSAYSNTVTATTPSQVRQITIRNLRSTVPDRLKEVVRVKVALVEGTPRSGTGVYVRSDLLTDDGLRCLDIAEIESILPGQSRTFNITVGNDYYVFIGVGVWETDLFFCPTSRPWVKTTYYVDANLNQYWPWVTVRVQGHASGNWEWSITGSYLNGTLAVTPAGNQAIPFTVTTFDPIP